jgi:hypothetical protein
MTKNFPRDCALDEHRSCADPSIDCSVSEVKAHKHKDHPEIFTQGEACEMPRLNGTILNKAEKDGLHAAGEILMV